MAEFGLSHKTAVRLMVRAICVASVALTTFAPAALWAADAADDPGGASPAAASTPGGSETIEVPDSASEPDYGNPVLGSQTGTTQIPQASPTESPAAAADSWSGDPVVNYQKAQRGYPYGQGIGSAEEFLFEGEDSVSPLGIKLRPDRRRLKSGEMAAGLLVLSVVSNGPADKAGVKPYRHAARSTLEAVSVAGAFFFPPAMFLVPVLESTQVGDSYDMIVGVDGFRVTSAIDFEDCMRDVRPGEIVYLSIVRDGHRLQVPVTVPNLVR